LPKGLLRFIPFKNWLHFMNETQSKPLFICNNSPISPEEFNELIKQTDALFEPFSHILIKIDHPLLFNAALLSAYRKKAYLYVCPAHYSQEEVDLALQKLSIELYVSNQKDVFKTTTLTPTAKAIPSDKAGALYIFTSATTGPAKITEQNWEKIQHSAKQAKKLQGSTWLMAYAIFSYAGLQVFFSAYHNQGTIYYPQEQDPKLAEHLVQHKVSVISATPTYWKMIISRWPKNVAPLSLEQATIGGEIVNQDVLDLIKKFFQPKRLTHIYASSEAGTTIVVSDEKEGFPVEYLHKDKDIQLRVDGNMLQIKSPYGMTTYLNAQAPFTPDGWITTGDLVEIRGDRVYFLGRADEVINVGGLKVNPEEVERVLCQLDEIAESSVYAKKSPITGNIVAADIVIKPGYALDLDSIYKRLHGYLQDFKIPRLIKQVQQIKVGPSGKKIRRK
jgi:acyl-coenzyme A synthetase/AMP-(fatty) acid ligase